MVNWIAPVASLLGGLLAPKPKWQVPDYKKIRTKAEEAGFNPLTALAAAPGQAVQPENYMGAAIADAGLMLANSMAQKTDAGKLDQARQENSRLKDQVQSLTLRPQVGGLYAKQQETPTLMSALGAAYASSNASVHSPNASSGRSVVGADGLAYNLGDPEISSQSDDSSRVPTKPLYILGSALEPTSGTSDSEALGSRYGQDFLSPGWIAGWAAFGTDISTHVGNRLTSWVPDGRHMGEKTSLQLSAPPSAKQTRYLERLSLSHNPGDYFEANGFNPATRSDVSIGDPRPKKRPSSPPYFSWPSRDAWPKFQLGRY